MSDYVEGIVAKATKKPTANGGTVYNICVDTADNGEEWFGCGFDDPKVNEGDEIGFDIEYKAPPKKRSPSCTSTRPTSRR